MVRLHHDDPAATGGPLTADVPQEAVSWMLKLGWYEKSAKAPDTKETDAKAASPKKDKAAEGEGK